MAAKNVTQSYSQFRFLFFFLLSLNLPISSQSVESLPGGLLFFCLKTRAAKVPRLFLFAALRETGGGPVFKVRFVTINLRTCRKTLDQTCAKSISRGKSRRKKSGSRSNSTKKFEPRSQVIRQFRDAIARKWVPPRFLASSEIEKASQIPGWALWPFGEAVSWPLTSVRDEGRSRKSYRSRRAGQTGQIARNVQMSTVRNVLWSKRPVSHRRKRGSVRFPDFEKMSIFEFQFFAS